LFLSLQNNRSDNDELRGKSDGFCELKMAQFLTEHDPAGMQSGLFCGLKKCEAPITGDVLFMCQECREDW
jgi:hypothetical protein